MSPDLLLRGVRDGPGGRTVDVRIHAGLVAEISAAAGISAADPAVVIDGAGATLLPGLRDGHVHLSQWATALQRIDLSHTGSAADAAAVMAAAIPRRPVGPGRVLTGFGFRDGLWPDAPHKDLLQRALPGVAAVLISQDLHCAWLSPAALHLIGVEHPTGLLREAECFAAIALLPEASTDQVDSWALDAVQRAAARGVTDILDFEFTDTVATWRRRFAVGGALPVRVRAAIFRGLLDDALAAGDRTGDVVAQTGGLVTVGPCKVLMDGSLNTRTALCHDAYPGLAGSDAHGLLTQDPAELAETMAAAGARGVLFAVHAIGDRANTLALDCFQRAGYPGRIEHAQMVSTADLPRFAALDVIASVQPGHAVEDRDVADLHWAGRTAEAFPYAALLAAGATLEFGSDAPVSRLDPWHAIASAVTRTEGDRPPWHGEQAVTFEQALAASTTGGRIRVRTGDVADLVLVRGDPAELDPSELRDIAVLATVVDGAITYRAE